MELHSRYVPHRDEEKEKEKKSKGRVEKKDEHDARRVPYHVCRTCRQKHLCICVADVVISVNSIDLGDVQIMCVLRIVNSSEACEKRARFITYEYLHYNASFYDC